MSCIGYYLHAASARLATCIRKFRRFYGEGSARARAVKSSEYTAARGICTRTLIEKQLRLRRPAVSLRLRRWRRDCARYRGFVPGHTHRRDAVSRFAGDPRGPRDSIDDRLAERRRFRRMPAFSQPWRPLRSGSRREIGAMRRVPVSRKYRSRRSSSLRPRTWARVARVTARSRDEARDADAYRRLRHTARRSAQGPDGRKYLPPPRCENRP